MPRKIREMLKLLNDEGWVVTRQKGSHRQLKHPDKTGTVTVAGHEADDLNPGDRKQHSETGGHQAREEVMRYAVVIEQGKRNFSAYVPDLPGCIATGKTVEDVKTKMAQAIEWHLEALAEEGQAIPVAHTIHAAATVKNMRNPTPHLSVAVR
ncbi:MAG: type II toxin-antitoxin system HicA family toxin [Geothrix sp.]|nr:type II toxin-antitoxin system HicA family toxin [Geothrix sp.]